jgi:hypothetical protein
MKAMTFGLAVGVVLALACVVAFPWVVERFKPPTQSGRRVITVNGTARHAVPPDVVRIRFGLFTQGDNVAQARKGADETARAVDKALSQALGQLQLPKDAYTVSRADAIKPPFVYGKEAVADPSRWAVSYRADEPRQPGKADAANSETPCGVMQVFTIEAKSTDVELLKKAVREVTGIPMAHGGTVSTDLWGPYAPWPQAAQVVFGRQVPGPERRRALDAAVANAVADAQSLSGSTSPVEVLEIVEYTENRRAAAPTGALTDERGRPIYGQIGGPPGPEFQAGLAPEQPPDAIAVEFIARVTVRCSY